MAYQAEISRRNPTCFFVPDRSVWVHAGTVWCGPRIEGGGVGRCD
ncbi:MAG: hypothetical protein RMI90_07505 [Thermoguttaceae bacterium]|nr:hypothetical protein [Thermoguttaceae bacterium]